MRRLHLVPEVNEANGVYQVARLLAERDGGEVRTLAQGRAITPGAFDEVWVHGMWLPGQWRCCRAAVWAGCTLVRMVHGSLSPIYLRRQSPWAKRLVAPIERFWFRRSARVVVTGAWEEAWCRAWGLQGPFERVNVADFFPLQTVCRRPQGAGLRVLYLGRAHPLKGVAYLEAAVAQLRAAGRVVELRQEAHAFGSEKEAAFAWADVLCLPSLSENFGVVVAEALVRGLPVIVTDGAPAWAGLLPGQGRYVAGYVAGSEETRVALLKAALEAFVCGDWGSDD